MLDGAAGIVSCLMVGDIDNFPLHVEEPPALSPPTLDARDMEELMLLFVVLPLVRERERGGKSERMLN